MRVAFVVTTLRGFGIVAACVLATPLAAHAQGPLPTGIGVGASVDVESIEPIETGRDLPRSVGERIWTAQFLCGEISPAGAPDRGSPLAPGSYRTAVNVFNGQAFHPAEIDLVLAVAQGPDQPQIPRVRPEALVIDPLRAVELDCDFIRPLFGNAPSFIKGFVQLAARRDAHGNSKLIKVGAVYTMKNVETAATSPN